MTIKSILYDWLGLNQWLFWHINGLGGDASYDRFMLNISTLGEQHYFPLYLVATALAVTLRVLVRGLGRPWPVMREELRPAFALLLAMVIGYAFCFTILAALKHMFAMPRPFVFFRNSGMSVHFIGAFPPPEKYYESFPSGHAAMVTFLVTAWSRHLSRHWRTLAVLFALLMYWSRIAVGMHFPVDVLVGAVIGAYTARLAQHYIYRFMKAA